MSRRLTSRTSTSSNSLDQPPMGPPPDRDRDYRDSGLSTHAHSHPQPINFKHSPGSLTHSHPGPASTAHHQLSPPQVPQMAPPLQNGSGTLSGGGPAPGAAHERREALTQAEVQEKYSRLKKRYFENERKHNELVKEYDEFSKRTLILKAERSVFMDRIFEMEDFILMYQDLCKKYDPDFTPPAHHSISGAFPTSLIAKKRRVAFELNLKQAMHECEREMEDPLHPATTDPRLTSKHVGPNAVSTSFPLPKNGAGHKQINGGDGFNHEQNHNVPGPATTRSSSRYKNSTPNPPVTIVDVDSPIESGVHVVEDSNIADTAFERGRLSVKRRAVEDRFVIEDAKNIGERETKRARRPASGASANRYSSGTSPSTNGSGNATPGGLNGNIPDEYQSQESFDPHYRDQRGSEEYAQEWQNDQIHTHKPGSESVNKYHSPDLRRRESFDHPDSARSSHAASARTSPQLIHPHTSRVYEHSHPQPHVHDRAGRVHHSQSQSPLSPPGGHPLEYPSHRGSSAMTLGSRDEGTRGDRDHAPSENMTSPTISVSSHGTMPPPGPTSAGSSSGSTTVYYSSRHSKNGSVSTPTSASSSTTLVSHPHNERANGGTTSLTKTVPTSGSVYSGRGVPLLSELQRLTKPKRLKAHTVTSKSFSIPIVPRDEKTGRPILPLNVGIMTVLKLGEVCMREHYHTERYIFPVGYEVTRRYFSTINPETECVYTCTILDGGEGPKFRIIAGDMPDMPIEAGTATGAWSGIVRAANMIRKRQHSNSVSGPDYFGLGQNTIKHLIQELPGANQLPNYVWQHFVEGGPLGGRHAAVIPALPEEYEAKYHTVSHSRSAPQTSPSTPHSPTDTYATRSAIHQSRESSRTPSSRLASQRRSYPSPEYTRRPPSPPERVDSAYPSRRDNEVKGEATMSSLHRGGKAPSGHELSVMPSPARPEAGAVDEDVEMVSVDSSRGPSRGGAGGVGKWRYDSEEEYDDENGGRANDREHEDYMKRARRFGRGEDTLLVNRSNGVARVGEGIVAQNKK